MPLPSRRLLLTAARRFLALFAIAAVAACFVGLVVAGLSHEHIRRAFAVGFYITGVCLAGLGVLAGSRPPVRSKGTGEARVGFLGIWSGGGVRWATGEEQRESMNLPAVLVGVGVALIPIGIAVDTKH